jgi:hypothetical protein
MDDLLKHDDTTAILINRVQDVAAIFCFNFDASDEYWQQTARACLWEDADLLSLAMKNVYKSLPRL